MDKISLNVVDSHQHFWQLARGDYAWLTPDQSDLYRDFMPSDLDITLRENAVSQSVLIQAAPTREETTFLLSLAKESAFVAGVVGWVDMSARDAPSQIDELSGNPYCLGLRPMIQDIDDTDWMLSPMLEPAFISMVERGLSFDALVCPRHLKNLWVLASRYPDLRIVINHCAKPNIASREFVDWAADMELLARRENVFCKFSGLVTEARNDSESIVEELSIYTNFIVDVFGCSKLMWGSDWPVVTSVMSYSQWLTCAQELVADLSLTEQKRIFSETAKEFYRL